MSGQRRQTGHGAPRLSHASTAGPGMGTLWGHRGRSGAGAGSAPQVFLALGATGTSLGAPNSRHGLWAQHLLPVRSRRGSRPMSSSGVES